MNRRTQRIAAVALVTILSLIAAACGGDDAVSAEAQPYVDALKQSLAENSQADDDITFTSGQIDCLAPKWIDVIGVDRLEANDVTPEDLADNSGMEFSEVDLTEEEGGELYDAFGACDVNIREVMIASIADDDEMSDEAKTCIEGVFTEENLRVLMVASLVNGPDAVDQDPALAPLMGQVMGCAFMDIDMDMGDMDMSDIDMGE